MEVSLAAEKLFSLGPILVTNSLLSALILFTLVIAGCFWIKSKLSYANPPKWQIGLELIVETLYNIAQDSLGAEKTKGLFPFLFTFFVMILVSNWFGLLPFVPTTAIKQVAAVENNVVQPAAIAPETILASTEAVPMLTSANEPAATEAALIEPQASFSECLSKKDCFITLKGVEVFEKSTLLFRAPSSDLSFTLALALISIFATNALGFKYLKLKYMKRYFDFSNPINAVVGIIELFSEISKIMSFSFRLFGNVFAGEMLLLVITSLTFGIFTLPFLALELFVGVIQAFVFFMLTSIFISVATSNH